MKALIHKILLKEVDEFDWTKELDVNKAEAEIKAGWLMADRNGARHALTIYDLLIDAKFHNLEVLAEIGQYFDTDINDAYESGRESGFEDCSCDGCCEEMIYYEDCDDREERARDAGKDEGRDEMQAEMQSRIDDLEAEVEDLKAQLQNRD